MTDKPKESADECFDIYLTEMGIGMKERRLIISYAHSLLSAKLNKQRKICFDRWKDASGFSNMPEVIKRAIVYAPEPL